MRDGFGGATPRRGFLGRAAGALAAVAGLTAARPESVAAAQQHEHDRWLERMTGKHRQLFDFNTPGDGIGLIRMRNFIDGYQSAYGAKPDEINAVGTFYSGTTPLAWNDSVWAKYEVGAALDLLDPRTRNPITRNWYAAPREGDPVLQNGAMTEASITRLVADGATFLLCRNALERWSARLAGRGGDAAAVRREILANLLPGVVLVPAMVIAVDKAQGAGISYMRV